jgi:NAD+ kinase
VRYFVVSNDQDRAATWRQRLRDNGFEIVEEYDRDATILTLGGDGTILYAARNYAEPTILPIRAGDSEGNRARFEIDELLDGLDRLESRDVDLDRRTFDTLAAYEGGTRIRDDFEALNEISLHHSQPVLAAKFAVRVTDQGRTEAFEPLIGDGALVATPFGSTGYYESITDGTFTTGYGLGFNNIHRPRDTPRYVGLSAEAVVEFELLELTGSSPAILTRDEDRDAHELTVGEPVEVRRGEKTVEIIGPAHEP